MKAKAKAKEGIWRRFVCFFFLLKIGGVRGVGAFRVSITGYAFK
jgi:hypothetical protein